MKHSFLQWDLLLCIVPGVGWCDWHTVLGARPSEIGQLSAPDSASAVSGHQGRVAHASWNLHRGWQMRTSLHKSNSQILSLLTAFPMMEKQSHFLYH